MTSWGQITLQWEQKHRSSRHRNTNTDNRYITTYPIIYPSTSKNQRVREPTLHQTTSPWGSAVGVSGNPDTYKTTVSVPEMAAYMHVQNIIIGTRSNSLFGIWVVGMYVYDLVLIYLAVMPSQKQKLARWCMETRVVMLHFCWTTALFGKRDFNSPLMWQTPTHLTSLFKPFQPPAGNWT